MRASQTVLPFKLTASDESLTAHAGLVLFDEYLGAMGIAGLINHELPGAGSAAGYDPSAHVAPLVLMLAGGGRTLEDLRILRRDDGLRCVVGLDDMPSSDASGDWMRRMGANESGGLAGLQRVNRCVFRRLLRADERTNFTLDIDATQAAYPVDSGFPRCSVLSDRIGAVARADTDGEGSVARGVPEVVSRRGELRGIFIQVALAGWFCVSRLWRAPRGWAEKPTAFA